MKTILSFSMVLLVSLFNFFPLSNKPASEERIIYGPTIETPNLHNVSGGTDCENIRDGKWCFKRSFLNVSVPNSKWVFIDSPYIDLVQDNDGAAGWNNLGASDAFWITLNNPDEKRAVILTGSRNIKVRLACKARYYPGK